MRGHETPRVTPTPLSTRAGCCRRPGSTAGASHGDSWGFSSSKGTSRTNRANRECAGALNGGDRTGVGKGGKPLVASAYPCMTAVETTACAALHFPSREGGTRRIGRRRTWKMGHSEHRPVVVVGAVLADAIRQLDAGERRP